MNKLLPLESLRGIAALTVVIFHFKVGSHFNNSFTNNGTLMVDFFFVLSGFVICLSYKDRLSSIPSLIEFQKRRFWRLYPLHLLMLFVFLAIEFAKYLVEIKFGLEANNPAFSENNVTSFVANLFLLHNWMLPNLTWNYPSWSISAEFFTYLIFATTLLIVKNKKVLVTIAFLYIVISGYLLLMFNWRSDINIISSGPARCVYGFFVGVVACLFSVRLQNLRLQNSLPATLLLILCVWGISNLDVIFYYNISLPLLFAAAIVAVAKTSDRTTISKILSDERFVWLGTISYGVYMIHAAVLWGLTQTLRFVFELPTKSDVDGRTVIDISSVWLADLLTIFAVAVTVVLASLSYRMLEKPLYRRFY
jgi:peptidoglycan/LPS O-acetylase OafA/YrhL